MTAPHPSETIVKNTISRCLVCQQLCPAQVYTSGSEVHMRRCCPTHGTTTAKISSDLRYYWTTDPTNSNQCCASDQCCSLAGDAITTLGDNARTGAGNYDKIATCFLLIDIVDSCNLPCPTCYAASPYGPHGEELRYTPFEEVVSRVESFLSRKGAIEVLMLSGGEPTLHPEFFKILDWTVRHPSITGVVINTNGVQLANDRFYSAFGDTYSAFTRDGIDHKLEIYLQFDGTQEEGQRELRGYDLRPTRRKVIDRMSQIALRMNLAMTVTEANLPHVWETVLRLRLPAHSRRVSPAAISKRESTVRLRIAVERRRCHPRRCRSIAGRSSAGPFPASAL